MKLAIACDHAGIDLKIQIVQLLKKLQYEVKDFGVHTQDSVDYPDYGIPVAEQISDGVFKQGILICGTGIGMSIVANKFPKVRAALCGDTFTAKVSRLHNDSNILVLGQRVTDSQKALEIVKTWLNTKFEGGRHSRRLEKIREIECRPNRPRKD